MPINETAELAGYYESDEKVLSAIMGKIPTRTERLVDTLRKQRQNAQDSAKVHRRIAVELRADKRQLKAALQICREQNIALKADTVERYQDAGDAEETIRFLRAALKTAKEARVA